MCFGINLVRCDGEFALHQLIHQETIQVGSGFARTSISKLFQVVSRQYRVWQALLFLDENCGLDC